MSDSFELAAPTAAQLEAELLEAKLSAPSRRPGSVSRASLSTRLGLSPAGWRCGSTQCGYATTAQRTAVIDQLCAPLKTTERDRSVQLVAQLTVPTYQSAQMSTVQRWLTALGPSAVAEYPPLAVLARWIAV